MTKIICNLIFVIGLSGCGGGGTTIDPTATPIPTPTADLWEPTKSMLEAAVIENLALIVGTAEGEVFRYEKGNFDVDQSYLIASSSKWLASATILALVEQGVLTLDDRPQHYLDYWSDDPQDPRSEVTLEQLLSFTSGFHNRPSQPECIGDEAFTVHECTQQLHDLGIDAPPGTTYSYGPPHMQIAAAMAEVATGLAWTEIVRLSVVEPLNLSDATAYYGNNPRASGGATSSATDYSQFLAALLSGEFLASSFMTMAEPRSLDVDIVFRPNTVAENAVDWHYGLGVWRECNQALWDESCASSLRISSPGAFGWYPWLDLDGGYYAVLAMQEPVNMVSTPSADSVVLGLQLHSLIVNALTD